MKIGNKFLRLLEEERFDIYGKSMNIIVKIVPAPSDHCCHIDRGEGVELVWKKGDPLIVTENSEHINAKDIKIMEE